MWLNQEVSFHKHSIGVYSYRKKLLLYKESVAVLNAGFDLDDEFVSFVSGVNEEIVRASSHYKYCHKRKLREAITKLMEHLQGYFEGSLIGIFTDTYLYITNESSHSRAVDHLQ